MPPSRRDALQAIAAVDAFEAAWATSPAAVSEAVAERAHAALDYGHYVLEESGGHPRDVDRALARFAHARHYAEAPPAVVGTVVEALEGGR